MRSLFTVLVVGLALAGTLIFFAQRKELPMQAPKKHTRLEKHGDARADNYFWMNERDSAPVLEFLNAENAYVEEIMGGTKEFREKLVKEMRGRRYR